MVSVKNYFSEMPYYARLFWKMPVNASGVDFSHKCPHFPNPDENSSHCGHYGIHVIHLRRQIGRFSFPNSEND